MENIESFLLDHAIRDEARWHRLPEEARGPYFVSARFGPRKARFLELVRRKVEVAPGFNPLDGREHRLGEIARWLRCREFALRFVGIGVTLGVFELASPWEPRAGEANQDTDRCLEWSDEGRFRLAGSRPREAIGHPEDRNGPVSSRRRPGPRRPRYTRGPWTRTHRVNRPLAM
jgi:hypothetical protein